MRFSVLFIFCTLIFTASWLAAQSPEITGNTIVCGNKTLSMLENGTMTLSVDGKNAGSFYYYFSIADKNRNKTYWFGIGEKRSFNIARSQLTRDGNKFHYHGVAKLDGREWDFYEQTVELTEEGLIRISGQWTPPPYDELEMGTRTFFFASDFSFLGGKKVVINAKEITIPEKKTKEGNETFIDIPGGTSFSAKFLPDEPDRSFSISGAKPGFASIRGWLPASGKGVTFWLNRGARSTTFDLDIRPVTGK